MLGNSSPGPSGPGIAPFNATKSSLDTHGVLFSAVITPPPPQQPTITLTVYQTLAPGVYTVTLP